MPEKGEPCLDLVLGKKPPGDNAGPIRYSDEIAINCTQLVKEIRLQPIYRELECRCQPAEKVWQLSE